MSCRPKSYPLYQEIGYNMNWKSDKHEIRLRRTSYDDVRNATTNKDMLEAISQIST
jgi:hypothetical protein